MALFTYFTPASQQSHRDSTTHAGTSAVELTRERKGGFRITEMVSGIPHEFIQLLSCCVCGMVAFEAKRADNASLPSIQSCDHLFCASCIVPAPFDCPSPGCGRYVPRVRADLTLDQIAAKLLRTGVLERRQHNNHAALHLPHQSHLTEDKRAFTDIYESDGWPKAHKIYPHVPWSTAYYWRTHPAVLVTEHRAPVSGHPRTFDSDEEEEIRGEVLRLTAPSVLDLIQISLNKATALAQTKTSRASSLLNFKAAHHWQSDFCKRRNLPLRTPHPVSKERYDRFVAAAKTSQPCTQELDMLWSLADIRAKRLLLQERGFVGDDRITLTDEFRVSPAIIYQKGHCQLLIDGRDPEATKQRTFVPVSVSQSFPSFTVLCTLAASSEKLAVMVIRKEKALHVKLPTRAEIIDHLGLQEGSAAAAAIPLVPILLDQSPTAFNNSHIHGGSYLDGVLRPFMEKRNKARAAEQRGILNQEAVHDQAAVSHPVDQQKSSVASEAVTGAQPDPLLHAPRNPRVYGSFHAHPFPEYGEVSDVFGGHIAALTRARYAAQRVFMAVVAACCTGFMQWGDVHLHHEFRPALADEIRRLLRLLPLSVTRLTEVQWMELVLLAICLVWYNPAFKPPEQTSKQLRRLGITLPLSGEEDADLHVRLFNKLIDGKLLNRMAQYRLQELKSDLASEPRTSKELNEM
jgi:hypothetical protein